MSHNQPKLLKNRVKINRDSRDGKLQKCWRTLPGIKHKPRGHTLGKPIRRASYLRVRRSRASVFNPPPHADPLWSGGRSVLNGVDNHLVLQPAPRSPPTHTPGLTRTACWTHGSLLFPSLGSPKPVLALLGRVFLPNWVIFGYLGPSKVLQDPSKTDFSWIFWLIFL